MCIFQGCLASFNYPEHAWIMLLGLPLVIPMPAIMLWLTFRSFRYSEPQSSRVIIALVLMLGIAILYHHPFRPLDWARMRFGFFDIWLLLMRVAIYAVPVTLLWEAYKNGWFRVAIKNKRKKRKKRKTSVTIGTEES
jgi:phosphatidylserine synthase